MATRTILDTIVERVKVDLATEKMRAPEDQLRLRAESAPPTRDFAAALRGSEGAKPRVIAELKRASPSRGLIRENFDVIPLSRELAAHGAAALSVLTEVHFFQGSRRFLQDVATDGVLPVLRKDFIVDPYQLYQARAWGADAVLLIAAVLDPNEFGRLHRLARELGLAVLSEAHSDEELGAVLDAGAEIVGINSRDLKTFKTDLAVTEELLAKLPAQVVAVAESGIHSYADIRRLVAAGAHAFLVGERLMQAPSPGAALAELLGDSPAGDGGAQS